MSMDPMWKEFVFYFSSQQINVSTVKRNSRFLVMCWVGVGWGRSQEVQGLKGKHNFFFFLH